MSYNWDFYKTEEDDTPARLEQEARQYEEVQVYEQSQQPLHRHHLPGQHPVPQSEVTVPKKRRADSTNFNAFKEFAPPSLTFGNPIKDQGLGSNERSATYGGYGENEGNQGRTRTVAARGTGTQPNAPTGEVSDTGVASWHGLPAQTHQQMYQPAPETLDTITTSMGHLALSAPYDPSHVPGPGAQYAYPIAASSHSAQNPQAEREDPSQWSEYLRQSASYSEQRCRIQFTYYSVDPFTGKELELGVAKTDSVSGEQGVVLERFVKERIYNWSRGSD